MVQGLGECDTDKATQSGPRCSAREKVAKLCQARAAHLCSLPSGFDPVINPLASRHIGQSLARPAGEMRHRLDEFYAGAPDGWRSTATTKRLQGGAPH
jgi:hypothetical protein